MLFQTLSSGARDNIFMRAKGKTISLPEGNDERVIKAAEILKKELNIKTYLGNSQEAEKNKQKTLDIMQKIAEKKGKPLSDKILPLIGDTTFEGGAKLHLGEVDAVVSGCVNSTAHVIRAALSTVGLKPQTKIITSAFLLALPKPTPGGEGLVLFADCGVIPQPSSGELVDIAYLGQEAYAFWSGQTPHVSFLSFSTVGSAEHPDVEKVRNAFKIFTEKYPNIIADGEVQFDTACVPSVAQRKNPQGKAQGKTNVFIFPDLDAGNIGYKITQRIGGAEAWGPILLGAAKPFSDLSRGASAEDIAHVAALTLALS
ncbi:phosphate acyltransferase [Pigmentibacter sp. JX0631]|uniref:phosphate acyltransferase n=1 Tax=Pigmentibacter sp. JX0631 TaxID=2976982 RepID=UPI0024683B9E|nr:phosphate acyltransferase [Pigmentibacter sp. JX0631]WGL60702.1 phosphate acyltransferase [Pigmentibacter sp. JX0631]